MTTQSSPSRLQLCSACLGNFFEHYDTALFGFLSVFLAPLIFPDKDPITALLLTYAMIPLGMLARPVGSLVFGYIGDNYGRKQALFLTLGGMAVVSGCIAVTPLYAEAGIFSPLIFGLGRVLQNFLAAGETMGGAIYLLENTPEKKHDFLSGLYNASTIGGILLASFGVFVISHFNVIEFGWRVLYVIGCLTAFFGSMIRRHLPTQNLNQQPKEKFGQSIFKLSKVFWENRLALFLIIVVSGFAYANYVIALVLMNGFIPLISSVTKAEMVSLNTILLVFDFCSMPFFGWLSSKISREKMMMSACLGVAVSAIPMCMMLEGATLFGIIGIRLCLVVFGVAFFAPFHAWAQQIVPSAYRYAIISFGYAMGSQLLGGPTAAISLWCYSITGMVSSISWYWLTLAVASSLALAKAFSMTKKVAIVKEAT